MPALKPASRNRFFALAAGVLSLSFIAAACPRSVKRDEPPKKVTVLLTADLRGYLEPCGCSENMLGGIQRAAAQVDLARKEGAAVVLADAGDSLFPRGDFSPEQIPQAERKAKAIGEAFRLMGNDAFAVGEKDLVRGVEFLKTTGLTTWLNAGEGPDSVPAMTLRDMGGVKVGFVAAGGPNAAETLQQWGTTARNQGAEVVIGLVHLPVAEAARVAGKLTGNPVDAILSGHSVTELDGEQNRLVPASVPVLQLMSKGRSLGRLDFVLRPGAPAGFVQIASDDERQDELAKLKDRIKSEEERLKGAELSPEALTMRRQHLDALKQRLAEQEKAKPSVPDDKSYVTARFIKLQEGMPEDAKVKEVIARYTKDTAELNLAWAKTNGKDCPAPRKGVASYVGSDESCESCHQEAFKVWRNTRHFTAYKSLADKNKQFDLDCVRCHVTGMNSPGGVCRVDKVDGRKDVQCESCHGPASLHMENPTATNIIAKPGEQNCRVCHTAENSTHFDFATYLPKVLGPGHGK